MTPLGPPRQRHSPRSAGSPSSTASIWRPARIGAGRPGRPSDVVRRASAEWPPGPRCRCRAADGFGVGRGRVGPAEGLPRWRSSRPGLLRVLRRAPVAGGRRAAPRGPHRRSAGGAGRPCRAGRRRPHPRRPRTPPGRSRTRWSDRWSPTGDPAADRPTIALLDSAARGLLQETPELPDGLAAVVSVGGRDGPADDRAPGHASR